MKDPRKKKRILFVIAVVVMLSSAFIFGAYGTEDKNSGALGYRDAEVEIYSVPQSKLFANDKAVDLPEKYNSKTQGWFPRHALKRDQNPWGTCWAFATTNAADISYAKDHNGSVIPTSPMHLAYFFYNRVNDPLGLTANDKNVIGTGSTDDPWYDQGGNSVFTFQAIANRSGLASEELAPYQYYYYPDGYNDNIANSLTYAASDATILSKSKISNSNDWKNAIKEAVLENGAAATSIKWVAADYNSTYKTHCTTQTGSNHAVTVIGWDDSFSKSKFKNSPAGDGAWIVLNSWGDDWGDENIFYVSYYDASIHGSYVVTYDMETVDSEDYLYQYDGNASTTALKMSSGDQVANLFTAQDDIILDSVGFTEWNEGETSYVISVYKDATTSNLSPGTAVATVPTKDAKTTHPGYHSFKLDKPIYLEKGDKYSVVVKFNGSTSAGVENDLDNTWVKFVAGIDSGQSFCKSSGYSSWTDYAKYDYCFRIKGIARQAYTVKFDTQGHGSAVDEQHVESGDIAKVPSEPLDNDYEFNGWYTDKDCKNKFNFDTPIDSENTSNGVLTLYALWEEKGTAITYDLDGGELPEGKNNRKSYNEKTQSFTLVNPVKTGYEFVGWSGSGLTGITNKEVVIDPSKCSGELSFKANWSEPIEYTIAYIDEMTGEDLTTSAPSTYTVEDLPIVLPNPTKSEYDFLGWTCKTDGKDEITTPETNLQIAVKSTGNRVYTAHWKKQEYTISYSVSVSGNPTKYTSSDEIELKAAPNINNNQKFVGWICTVDGITEISTPYSPVTIYKGSKGNRVYTAKYAKTTAPFTVQHFKQKVDGSYSTSYDEQQTGMIGENGKTVSVQSKNYDGFSYNSTKSTNSVTLSSKKTSTLKLYYERNKHNVYYEGGNGAEGTMTSQTDKLYGSSVTLSDNKFTKSGYVFTGWKAYCNGEEITITDGKITMPNGDVTVIAQWEKAIRITYTVDSSTKGSVSPTYEDLSASSAKANGSTATANRGYKFDKWTNANGMKVGSDVKYVPTKPGSEWVDATYKACFIEDTKRSVIYASNGGDGTMTDDADYYAGDSVSLKTNTFTKTGYEFNGWVVTTAGGKTVTVSNNKFTMPEDNVTITAQWKLSTYTIRYSGMTDASVATANPTSYTVEDSFTLNNPTKLDYTFDGWTYSGHSTPNKSITISKGTTGDITFTANWTAKAKVKMTYAVNDAVKGSLNKTSEEILPDTGKHTVTATAKAGYKFVNWTVDGKEVCTTAALSVSKTAGTSWTATSYVANFTERDDTAYKVEHYQQKVDLSGYTLAATEDKTGTTDGLASITAKNYTGFSLKGALPTATIAADGSTVVKVFYDRNTHKITYKAGAGEGQDVVVTDGVYYGNTVALNSNTFTRTGYEFNGWKVGTTTTIKNAGSSYTVTDSDIEMTAQWKKVSYNISYELNGGTVTGNPTTYDIETATFKLNNPTKKGYTFAGWTGSNGDTAEESVTISIGTTGDKTYTANWNKETYNISYDLAGGSYDGATNPETYDIESEITLNQPIKNGYTFTGWTWSGHTTPTKVVKIESESGDKSYTANWQIVSYSISYIDGVTGEALSTRNPTTYNIETANFTLTNPTKKGYTFIGWSGTNLTGNLNTTVTVTKGTTGNLTFTANFEEKDTVTISYASADTTMGTVTAVSELGYDSINPETGTPQGATATANTGYTFVKWVDAEGVQKNTNATFVPTMTGSEWTTTEYKAVFAPKTNTAYKIEHYQQKADLSGYVLKESESKTGTTGAPVTASTKSYTGFTYNSSIPGTLASSEIAGDGKLVLKLYYDRNKYKVTYIGNGATGGAVAEQINQAYGSTVKLNDNSFTRNGYSFNGWKASESNGTSITIYNDTITMPDCDVTVTAQWKTIVYTIEYAGDNTSGLGNPSTYSITSDSITLANPKKDDYTFDGWTSKVDGKDEITVPSTIVTISSGSVGNRVYTANWTEKPLVTMTYQVNSTTMGSVNVASQQIKPDTGTINVTASPETGYKFVNWTVNGSEVCKTAKLTVSKPSGQSWAATNYVAIFAPNSATEYTVKHYQQNVNLDGYQLSDTEILAGTTGSDTKAVAKSYEGFKLNSTVQQKSIAADGSTVIEIKYDRLKYTLSYNNGGGNGTIASSTNIPYGKTVSLNNGAGLTKTGYSFDGWDVKQDSKSILVSAFNSITMPAGNVVATAKWKTINYSITYKLNGGIFNQGVTNPSSYTIESDITVNNPHRDGYSFKGWTWNGHSTPETTVNIKNASGDKTYTANWTKLSMKVSYGTSTYTYNKKSHTLSVKVVNNLGEVLTNGTDYTISGTSKATKPKSTTAGKYYTVTVTGKGDYVGAKSTKKWYINVKPNKITKFVRASKAFTVYCSKLTSTYATGYQLRYSVKSSMSKAKIVTISKSTKINKKKISNLRAKKKYYVQVRAYKTISGKKYYSKWSTKKSITTK